MSQEEVPGSDSGEAPKESKVETAKRRSRHLRGTIAETLASGAQSFDQDDTHLLKFHGVYQQENREERKARRKEGLEGAHSFMVRVAMPGGALTAEQYLALDALADRWAGSSLRATSRQGIQFHGVLAGDLKAHIAAINATLLTTLSACGDVGRNVMVSPAPLADPAYGILRRIAREVAVQLRPASRAYHEIWLDAEKVATTQEKEEPFYGDTYLPRKFKTGITLASESTIDVWSDDCGLIALIENGRLAGFDVVVGGGMGMTHRHADTVARLADPLGFVGPEHAVATVKTVASIFRDHGNRADRRHARLKYLIEEWGIDRFREEFRRRIPFGLGPWRPFPKPEVRDYLGPHPQGDGKWFYGVFVESGRIADRGPARFKTALRAIVSRHCPGVIITPSQNVLLTGLDAAVLPELERTLREYGVPTVDDLSAARRYALACPAMPTCGLALAEAERLMPSLIARLEAEIDALGRRHVPLTIRMTGCPNGCSRPYTADIAFVGRKADVYHIYVGGSLAGDRVADLYAVDVSTAGILDVLRPLLQTWARERLEGEGLGDFHHRRSGRAEGRRRITGEEKPLVSAPGPAGPKGTP